MSNYTGGGRNHAKHRYREPGSRVPLATRNPFTSDGIAVTRVPEKQNAPIAPNFDFKHAKNASNKPIAGKGLVQAVNSRIDAIPSEFILNNPTVTTPKTLSKSALEALAHGDDPRSRVLKRLNQPSFSGLPPLKARKPGPSSLKRRRDDISPIFSPPTQSVKRTKPAFVPAPAKKSEFEVSQFTPKNSIHDECQVVEYDGIGIEQRYERHSAPVTPKQFQSDPTGVEDILSWSPDSFETRQEDGDFLHSDEDLFTPDKSPSSNPFLTYRTSAPALIDQVEDACFTQRLRLAEECDKPSDQMAKPLEEMEVLTGASPGRWLHSPKSTIPTERLRLAGDRTGVGLPLKRWVGDGLELDHDEGLFPTVYHLDSDGEDEDAASTALSWLERPYENHLVDVHGVMEQHDQADLAIATATPDIKDAEEFSEEFWLRDFAEGEELVDTGSSSERTEGDTEMPGSIQTAPTRHTSPEEVIHGWELEDDVVEVIPMPVEDEEVFILAPTLFDFD